MQINSGNPVTQSADHGELSSEQAWRVRIVLEYARHHLGDQLSLPDLARVGNVCPGHLCKLFQRYVGQSPREHLKRLRLEAAAKTLLSTSLSVKEVMATVGL